MADKHSQPRSLNLTDTAGSLVATLVSPTADTGVISNSGIFFPQARAVVRWEVDQKLAFFTLNGVGPEAYVRCAHLRSTS